MKTSKIELPKFTLLEKTNTGGHCDRCGRAIKNVYSIRNNETKECGHYGAGCAKKVMGMSITEVYEANKAYDEAIKRFEKETLEEENGRTFVQEFKEAEPEMLEYIVNNLDNNFIADMKKQIEEKGSLTDAQYAAVWSMMKPFVELEKGSKIETLIYPIKMKIEESMYGWQYTVIGLNENNEKIRVYFSSLNKQKEDVLENAKILEIDNYGNRYGKTRIELDNPIKVKGTFDGYKLKRAKISMEA